jgi:CTP synthase
MPFIEALRQFSYRVGHENFCSVLVSLVPVLGSGEQVCLVRSCASLVSTDGAGDATQKTKPTQHCVKEMRGLGMAPDMIFCRSPQPVEADTKVRLSAPRLPVPGPR